LKNSLEIWAPCLNIIINLKKKDHFLKKHAGGDEETNIQQIVAL
jgi:hypothetical protein